MSSISHFLTRCLSRRTHPARAPPGEKAPVFTPYTDTPPTHEKLQTEEELAECIVETLFSAPLDSSNLHQELSDLVHSASWTETLAVRVLTSLQTAIETAKPMGEAMQTAFDHVRAAARETWEWVEEHPVEVAVLVATVIAIGILVYFAVPWVLQGSGFAKDGIRLGSWAARWQSRYRGYVPVGSWFSYWQKLGATIVAVDGRMGGLV